MKKYRLVNIQEGQRLHTSIGVFSAKDLTDEIAEKILEKHPKCGHFEKIEVKKSTPKVEPQE